MAEHLSVVPADLRKAAHDHRQTAERLGAAPSSHPDIVASLESLGPVFADLRDAGQRLLEERRACYEQQAAAHADLADKLSQAADIWDQQDLSSAEQLRGAAGGGP